MVSQDDRLKAAAKRFLKTGKIGRSDPSALADACDRLVRAETQRSLKKAADIGRTFVKVSRRNDEMPLQIALRALGWALHSGGKYRQAEKVYLEARTMAGKDASLRARIDRILIDIYMYLGDMPQARRRAKAALTTFARLDDQTEAAKTRINYANLLHRLDRHRDANRQYQQAAEYFEKHGGELILGLCYYNQGNTLVQLLEFPRARLLYKKAVDKFDALGFDLYVNECKYGLAWVNMLEGDYHIALSMLYECETKYKKAGQLKGVMLCKLDRAEAFLGLNLFDDARRAATGAEREAKRLGLRYESSKAAFFGGKALHALGRSVNAEAAIKRAEQGFAQENNQGFLAAVQLFIAQIDSGAHLRNSRLKAVRQKFSRAQLPLWEAICDLQLLSSQPSNTAARRRLTRNPAVDAVPHLYAHWQTALGDAAAEQGRMRTASRHWGQAVARLDVMRAKLPPVEMRSSFMRDRSDPYLRLIHHEAINNPLAAAVCSERYRTAGLWSIDSGVAETDGLRQKAAHSLAILASRVTALSGRLSRQSGKRSLTIAYESRALAGLQRQVRQNLAAMETSNVGTLGRRDKLAEDFARVSQSYPVVQFHFDGDDLIAFVHDRGEVRTVYIADGRNTVNRGMGCLRILLCRSLQNNSRQSRTGLDEERRLFEEIGSSIWSPLGIPVRRRQVLIIPDGELSNMPWAAIRADGQALVDRHRIIVAPSLRHHLHATDIRVRSGQVDVFVGEGDDLSHTQDDLATLIKRNGDKVTIHKPCRRTDWPDARQARIWHYAGHAHFRSDNPFYSSLMLGDGPLFAADFRLKSNRVWLVTLAACHTAVQTVFPGEEITGLVRSMLEMGARNVVGSHWAISDQSTAYWMNKFYDLIYDGRMVSEALRLTALKVREKYPSAYDWAAFSVFGAG